MPTITDDRPPVMQVRAADLKQGDLLIPTQRTVISASAGTSTPSGKVDVVTERRSGKQNEGTWGANTMITIRDREFLAAS